MTHIVTRQRVVPVAAWVTAGILFLLVFSIFSFIMARAHDVPVPLRVIIPIMGSLMLAGYTLLVGYVYGDARRRGMRYVMWTLLAIFLTNGIGVILYFILREPLQVYCSACGAGVQASHAYCPRCGAGVQPACPACHRILQPGWTHCAWCGSRL